jgi:hypothetical protein
MDKILALESVTVFEPKRSRLGAICYARHEGTIELIARALSSRAIATEDFSTASRRSTYPRTQCQ